MPETSDVPPQACPACGTLVDTAAAEPLALVACPKCGEKIRVQRSFDHFLLVETLGVGGMGSVYKARDTRLDRLVALKLLRKELSADPAEAARLEQEARLTAAVNHPHVIQVYSTGHAHDQIYLVMELVDHGSLDDLMAQHPRVPEADVLRAGIQVAKGLQAAHAKGLIHRDVKPANILFADAETAKIGDFGLAVTAGQHAEAAREIWGTPYYVAPERLNNEPEDFRSDIYSLGATLFHALAGRPPIEGETTSASELRKLKSNPPHLREIVPDISPATDRIIHQMLAPAPADRFRTYAQLIAALEHAAAGDDAEPEKKSRAPLAILILLLALAVLAGGSLYFFKTNQPPAAATTTEPTTASPAPSTAPLSQAEENQREQERLAAEKEAAEQAAREAEREQLLAAESPAWEKARAAARARIKIYDFSAALAAINSASVTEPSLVEAQTNERKKIEWLIAWKKQLIADLNTGRNHTLITRVPKIEYDGVSSATESEIMLRIPGARGSGAPFKWTALTPAELLQISQALIGDDPRYASRRWLAAVFAAETGQMEAARTLAETAAKAKPDYVEDLPLILPPAPKP